MKTGDIGAMYINYADNAVISMAGIPTMNGRAAIEEGWKDMFATTTVTDVSFNTDDLVLSGDVAIKNGSYRMTTTTNNAKPMTESGRYLTVWRHQPDGSWRIIRDMSTPGSTAAPGAN